MYNNARLVPGATFFVNSEALTTIETEQTLPVGWAQNLYPCLRFSDQKMVAILVDSVAKNLRLLLFTFCCHFEILITESWGAKSHLKLDFIVKTHSSGVGFILNVSGQVG